MLNKFFMCVLSLIIFLGLTFSIGSNKSISLAASSKLDSNKILEFLKEGYNAYWYLDDSLNKDYIVKVDNNEYIKVKKNFYSIDDIKKYFYKYYTKEAADKFIKQLAPKIIEGELYVLAGEAGDKPYIETAQIVDKNLKKGYITIKFKNHDGEDMYIKANVLINDNNIKIINWKVL